MRWVEVGPYASILGRDGLWYLVTARPTQDSAMLGNGETVKVDPMAVIPVATASYPEALTAILQAFPATTVQIG